MKRHRIPQSYFCPDRSFSCPWARSPRTGPKPDDQARVLEAFHGISSHALLEYVRELASDKYEGRLTGTASYDACAEWTAALLKKWGSSRPAATGPFPRPSEPLYDRPPGLRSVPPYPAEELEGRHQEILPV